MTKQSITLIAIICITISVSAQEKVLELSGFFSKKTTTHKDSYAISNEDTKDLMIVTDEGKVTGAILLDYEYRQKVKIVTKPLPNKYKNLIGYSIYDNIYSCLFTNDKNTKYAILQFDINSKFGKQKELSFKLKKEKYLETVIYNNQIYLISISKRSSDLNIYKFDENFSPEKHTISLKQIEYISSKSSGFKRTAYTMMDSSEDPFRPYVSLTKIEPRNPNIIETTSKPVKLYQNDNIITLSFDNSNKETKLCYINLDTFTLDYKAYNKPTATEKGYTKSNSYIFDNKLFQIASSSEKMKFTILDLTTEKMIKEYSVTKKDSINFKNSPIIQEKGIGIFGEEVREMEKTSKYLRKISSADLGISVYKVGDEYNIILGGTKEIQSGGGFAPDFGGGPGIVVGGAIGGSVTVCVGYNPTFYNYGNYTSTKSTYINCLFDQNFEHLQGDIQDNIFDRVHEFEDNLEKEPKAVNIFLHLDNLHYGYFDKVDKLYKLYRFKK